MLIHSFMAEMSASQLWVSPGQLHLWVQQQSTEGQRSLPLSNEITTNCLFILYKTPPDDCMFILFNTRRMQGAAQMDGEITFISIIKYGYDWLWTQRGHRSPAWFFFIIPWYLRDGLQCCNKRPMNGAHPVLICLLNIRVNFQMYL